MFKNYRHQKHTPGADFCQTVVAALTSVHFVRSNPILIRPPESSVSHLENRRRLRHLFESVS